MALNPLFGRGTLRMWDDEKGFGFIDPMEGGADVFIHISALGVGNVRPEIGSLITYRRTLDEQQRPRAVRARLEGSLRNAQPSYAPLPDGPAFPTRQTIPLRNPGTGIFRIPRSSSVLASRAKPSRRSQSAMWALLEAALFPGALTVAAWFGAIALWVPMLYVVASCVTFFAYAWDKTSAQDGEWRVSENTLHLLELLGGWPGALLAQQCLRHKTVKSSYQVIFWLIVAAHVGLWAWLGLRQVGMV